MNFKSLSITIISEKKVEYYDLKKILELEFKININIESNFKDPEVSNLEPCICIIDAVGTKNRKLIKNLVEKYKFNVKFIVLSEKSNNYRDNKQKVKFFKLPFRLFDLVSYIYGFFRAELSIINKIFIKDFEYYYERSSLTKKESGKKIILTEMENRFINYLISVNKPVSKKEILANVWGYQNNMNTHTLESLVYRVRNKVEDNPRKPIIICSKGNKYFLSK